MDLAEMTQPPDQKTEQQRLRTLRDLGILAAPESERLDRVTRVTAAAFDVPIALITLVDEDGELCKACHGAEPFTPRAFLGGETNVVADALADPAHADDPLVTGEPHLRFFAGHALTDASGERLGTLCLVDRVPRTLDQSQRALLRDMAEWAQDELCQRQVQRTVQQMARTIERLHSNETALRTVIDRVGEGIITFTEGGHILSTNRAAELAFGVDTGELVGKNLEALLDVDWTDVSPRLNTENPGARGTILGERLTITGSRRDGTHFPLELVVNEATIEGMRVLIGVGADVSERHRAEAALRASEDRFRAIFDGAGIGMAITDADGKIIDANGAMADMLNYSVGELRGASSSSLCHADDIAGGREMQEKLWKGVARRLQRETRYRRRNGSLLWATVTASLILDGSGDPRYVVEMAEDITVRKEAERLKDEFISVVGHELRTPLTSIRGSLGLIQGGVLGEVSKEAGEMLAVAVSNSDRLVRLINDMLDIERMDAGRADLDLAAVPAADLVDQALQVVGAMADSAGVTLGRETDEVTVSADTDRVVQALVNLLSNAIKFSTPGDVVTVGVRREAKQAIFSVRDTGRGIPTDQLETVFERFRQVDSSDAREKGGTGLGLAIARRIVEQHAGRIWAESVEGEGTTFRFTLPRAKRGMHVLVCGDAPREVDWVTDLVTTLGYTPLSAGSVDQALAAVSDSRPDAVVVPLVDDAHHWVAGLAAPSESRGIPVVAIGPGDGREGLLESLTDVLPTNGSAGTVLIVEDDPALGQVLLRSLSADGASPRLVRTAREAADAIRSSRPSVVILDLVLPDDDGFSVVEELRGEGLLSEITLLVYTALDLSAGDRERLQLGRTEFLAKGVASPQDLRRRVAELLGRVVEGRTAAR